VPRVLVIDDDSAVGRFAGFHLGNGGFEVELAGDRTNAFAALRSRAPDVVLCDLFLPDDCGLELMREVAAAYPAVGVVAMSGGGFQGRVDVLQVARVLGARAVLRKPFSGAEIVLAVRTALVERGPPGSGPECRPRDQEPAG
jgi:CheY-like chemotaxis protein